MTIRLGNFASAKLASAPSGTSGLSFTVEAGTGARFPVLNAGEWFYVVIKNSSLVREVVKVSARTTDAFTIATAGRGLDGSAAYASWVVNDVVELCLTNIALLDLVGDAGRWAVAGGTPDAITANYTPDIYELVDGQVCFVRAASANATTTPTFQPDGLIARTIVKEGGSALEIGSIRGAGHELCLRYNLANTRWELLNPVTGFHSATEDTTPDDAHEIGIWNAVTGALGKITIANLIAKLAALTSTWAISTTGNAATSTTATTAGIPQNSKSAAYTTVLADANKHILHPTTDNNARTFTIDSNATVAYAIGTTITFVNQINTLTIAITADTMTLAGLGTTGNRTLAANGLATALKVSSTGWIISGNGLT
jgi:hypothetical protein